MEDDLSESSPQTSTGMRLRALGLMDFCGSTADSFLLDAGSFISDSTKMASGTGSDVGFREVMSGGSVGDGSSGSGLGGPRWVFSFMMWICSSITDSLG